MIPHLKKLLTAAVVCITTLYPWYQVTAGGLKYSAYVERVIDGDTLEISGGERVRLLGLDAPERGEDLSSQASKRLRELTTNRRVELEACEDRDNYGRILATVFVDGVNVNTMLLREGFALPMLIPPCGRSVASQVLDAAVKGAMTGRGLFSLDSYRIYAHTEAADLVGEKAVVSGKITGLHKGRKAWHLNFGEDWKTDFTAVLFRDGQRRFRELGVDPAELVGSEVLVIGKVKSYNGPEIIVRGPEQILPLEGSGIQNQKSKIQNGSKPK